VITILFAVDNMRKGCNIQEKKKVNLFQLGISKGNSKMPIKISLMIMVQNSEHLVGCKGHG